jgi:hypothetical protein
MSNPVSNCALLPGCMSTGAGWCAYDYSKMSCGSGPPYYGICGGPLSCPNVSNSYTCDGASNCRWTYATDSCTGEPIACASLLTSAACSNSYNCTWQVGACTGTPTPCSQLSTYGECSASANCSWLSYL